MVVGCPIIWIVRLFPNTVEPWNNMSLNCVGLLISGCFSVYTQSALHILRFLIRRFNQLRMENSTLIRSWESADTESQLCIVCAILCKRLE